MGFKINIFSGTEWSNILTHENVENSQGGNGIDEFYHLSSEQYSWLDQDISNGSNPSFYNTNMSGDISVWNNDANYVTIDDVFLNVFTQSTPASAWNINHNFNSKYVLVQVYKDDDIQIYPQTIELLDNNNLRIEFNESITGYAIYSKISGVSPVTNPTDDHGSLSGLLGDDHTQYILVDGTRGFTNPISGITPVSSNHLTTKTYVDNKTWLAENISDFDTAISLNSDVALNTSHRTSDGSDHTFIDQDVTIGSAPQLSNVNMYGPISTWTNDSEYIDDTGVTFENLNTNGDIGTGSTQVSKGDHIHHNMFFSSSPSGDIDITNNWTDLTFESNVITDSYYSVTNDSEVEFSQTGLYKIKYDVSTYITSYTDECDSLVRIVKDTGSGYNVVDGSVSGQFNGPSDDGLNSSSKEILVSINNGDTIKIQAKRENGSSTIKTYPNSCTFLIEFLK